MVLMVRVNKSMQIVLVMINGEAEAGDIFALPPLHVEVGKTGS